MIATLMQQVIKTGYRVKKTDFEEELFLRLEQCLTQKDGKKNNYSSQ